MLLAAYEDHIGGIVSNGLTNADIGKHQAVGGLFYEFTRRVVRHYRPNPENLKLCRDGYWYEADLAEKIFHDWIAETGGRIRLLLSHKLIQAEVRSNSLKAIVLENRADLTLTVRISAAVFVDGTYEGDLAASPERPSAPARAGRNTESLTRAASICVLVPNCCRAQPAKRTMPRRLIASAFTSRTIRVSHTHREAGGLPPRRLPVCFGRCALRPCHRIPAYRASLSAAQWPL